MRGHNMAVLMLVVFLVGKSQSRDPPRSLKNRYEKFEARTMEELITAMLGGIGAAVNMMQGENGNIMAELDMVLTPEQFVNMYQPPSEEEMAKMGLKPAQHNKNNNNNSTRSKRKAARDTTLRWPNAEIPYLFAGGDFSKPEEYMMRRAMTEWERYTCIKFRPANDSDKNSLRIQGGLGCNSQLGMVGGVQILNLQPPGCRFKGLYLHEIGHAIGLVHEHQLPDRDNYISILYHNIEPHMRIWFNKYSTAEVNQMRVPYEYSSVMHYGVTAFSKDQINKTIEPLDKTKEASIGNVYLKELAYSDVWAVNLMYNCSGHCPDQNKCGSDGHLDQNCNCICRDGSSDCDRTKQVKNDSKCVNTYDSWACYVWANQGECERNPVFMESSCSKACAKCGGGADKTETTCADVERPERCAVWRSRGDCVTNVVWMTRHCRQTCNLCGDVTSRSEVACNDTYTQAEKCVEWAVDGECRANPDWMFENCQKSCSMCGDTEPAGGYNDTAVDEDPMECVDKDDNCAQWADIGECTKNPSWMVINCRYSCQKCEDGTCKNLDDDEQCEIWAEKHECQENLNWMARVCAKACGSCEGNQTTTNMTQNVTVSHNVTETLTPKVTITLTPDIVTPKVTITKTPIVTEAVTSKVTNVVTPKVTETVTPKVTETVTPKMNSTMTLKMNGTVTPKVTGKVTPKATASSTTKVTIAVTTKVTQSMTPTVTTQTVTKPTANPKTRGPCINNHTSDEECRNWANHGHCAINPQWMGNNCAAACNFCTNKTRSNSCHDTQVVCSAWAKDGHCTKNPSYMLTYCQKSCRVC